MDTQERDVILNRVLAEMRIVYASRYGFTVREIAKKIREIDANLDFIERTIRRDCIAFARHGMIESPGEAEGDLKAWRIRPVAFRRIVPTPGGAIGTDERDIILGRILAEMALLIRSTEGLTVREITIKLTENNPRLEFSERTVRRDCAAFEYHGMVEPRDEESGTWRVKASDRLRQWFPKGN